MGKVMDNGIIRSPTQEEIAAWEEVAQNTPDLTPTPEEQSMFFIRSMAETATNIPDKVAISIPDLLRTWPDLLAAGKPIQPGVCLTHNGQVYRMVQPSAVLRRFYLCH